MKKMFYVAFIATALVDMANTNARTAAAKRGGICIGPFRDGDSMLQCEYIGKITIKQIYEKDFHVVRVQDDRNTATYMMLVIKEQ